MGFPILSYLFPNLILSSTPEESQIGNPRSDYVIIDRVARSTHPNPSITHIRPWSSRNSVCFVDEFRASFHKCTSQTALALHSPPIHHENPRTDIYCRITERVPHLYERDCATTSKRQRYLVQNTVFQKLNLVRDE